MFDWKRRITIVTALSLVLTGGGLVGAAVAAPTSSPCGAIVDAGLTAAILSPVRSQKVKLGDDPELQVLGVATGSRISDVIRVDLYGDGVALGPADITRSGALRPAQFWKTHRLFGLSITPPPGKRTLTVCISTAAGVVAVATTTFTAVAPPAGAPLIAPDVQELSASTLSSLVAVDSSGLTFSRPPALAVGDVVVAGVTPKTPDGLLRRVVAITRSGGGTRAQTEQASLTDAVLQADIHLTQPLEQRSSPQTPGIPSSRGSARASSDPVSVKYSGKLDATYREDVPAPGGLKGKGQIRISDALTIELTGSLRMDLKIVPTFSWVDGPSADFEEFRVEIIGTQKTTRSTSVSGRGSLEKVVVPRVVLASFLLPTPIPVPVTLQVETSVGAEAELAGSAGGDLSSESQFNVGFFVDDGGSHGVFDTSDESSLEVPGAFTGTARIFHRFTFSLLLAGVAGPKIEFDEGIRTTGTAASGCEVRLDAGVFSRAAIGGEVKVFSTELAQIKVTLAEIYHPIVDLDLSTCAPDPEDPAVQPSITTTTLPDAVVGVAYRAPLAGAAAGMPSWSVAQGSLPPGLRLSADGVISGIPERTGTSAVTFRLTDLEGSVATSTIEMRVAPALPAPVVPQTDDGGGSAAPAVIPAAPGCGGSCAVSWGDPHLTTFDGLSYDLQQVGEFTLVKSSADDLEVQVRQQPYASSRIVSGNTAVAASVAGHRVVVSLVGGAVRAAIDGRATSATRTSLPGGGDVVRDEDTGRWTITWPDGSFVAVESRDGLSLLTSLGLSAARAEEVSGLLGNANGAPADDLQGPTGTPHTATDLVALGDEWRIAQAESLFDYATGQSTDTMTDRGFPYGQIAVADLPAAHRDAAVAACAAAGVVSETTLADCILDVAISGRLSAATSAASAQDAEGSIVVPGDANVFAVAGTDPLSFPYGTSQGGIAVPVTPGQTLRISASGKVGCIRDVPSSANPDGTANCPYPSTDVESSRGVAGLRVDGASMFLAGVFAGRSLVAAAPGRLDFSSTALTTQFAELSPLLQQTFFIGDGRTSAGVSQEFSVPAGAEYLYLGTVDAPGINGAPAFYDDNAGHYSVVVEAVP